MKQLSLLTLLISIMWSCSPKTAQFITTQSKVDAPSKVTLVNTSTTPGEVSWSINGTTLTGDSLEYELLSSGSYPVEMTIGNGSKKSVAKDTIHILPPGGCQVLLRTDFGDIMLQLFDETPLHRDNFIKLVESNFYDGTLFHRVIDGFMIQGGDPNSKGAAQGTRLGMGGPGYTLPAEIIDTLAHTYGALSAARQGDQVNPKRNSSGSQFYIVQGRKVNKNQLEYLMKARGKKYTAEQINAYTTQGGTPELDGAYTVFGKVVYGMEVVNKIAKVKKDRADRPVEDIAVEMFVIK